jgi:hypothetical protein
MADNEIKVVSAAVNALTLELQKLELQLTRGMHRDEYTAAILKLRDGFAATKVSTDLLVPGLLRVETALGKVTVGMSGGGGLGKTLADINTKLGNTRPLVTSMSQAMQDSAQFSFGAAQGIRAVANNIEMMVQQMTYLKSTGMSTGAIFGSMVATMKGPIGILFAFSALSAAIQWVVTGLQQTKKEAKDTTKEMSALYEEVQKLQIELGGSKQARISLLSAREFVYQHRLDELTGASDAVSPRQTMFQRRKPLTQAEKDEVVLLERDILLARKERLAYAKEDTKELEKQTKELEKQYKELRAIWEKHVEISVSGESILPSRVLSGRAAVMGYGAFSAGGKTITQAGGYTQQLTPSRVAVGRDAVDALVPDVVIDRAKLFGDTLKHGIIESTNILTQRLMQALNLGDSLAAKIAGSVGGSLLSAGITTGLSYIPFVGPLLSGVYNATNKKAGGGWINEPVFGVGLNTRQTYAIGERGPEYVSPASSNRMGQQGRGGGMMQPIVNVYNRLTPTGLATTVEIGGNQLGKVRY